MNPGYEAWKTEMKRELDRLVAMNFSRLYHASAEEYGTVWGRIETELSEKYGLKDITTNDPDYMTKRMMSHCISVNRLDYARKEFPWELSNPCVLRFVNQYGQLPKQLPREWAEFEAQSASEQSKIHSQNNSGLVAALERYAENHPEHAGR